MDPADILLLALASGTPLLIVGIVVAFRRRRRQPGLELSGELAQRLERIETAIEAVAIEVERMSELQRFEAKLNQLPSDRPPERIARQITPH